MSCTPLRAYSNYPSCSKQQRNPQTRTQKLHLYLFRRQRLIHKLSHVMSVVACSNPRHRNVPHPVQEWSLIITLLRELHRYY